MVKRSPRVEAIKGERKKNEERAFPVRSNNVPRRYNNSFTREARAIEHRRSLIALSITAEMARKYEIPWRGVLKTARDEARRASMIAPIASTSFYRPTGIH